MSNLLLRRPTALIVSLIICFFNPLNAQKAGLEVTRANAIDRNLPVLNVAVDASGRKWASNKNGVVQIKAVDFGAPPALSPDDASVLSFKGGNAEFSWSKSAFNNLVKTECTVTAAWYDEKNAALWVGTDEAGLFQFKTAPQLQLVEKFTSGNSKLKSNNVTVIFQDKTGRMWVGSDNGLMYGTPGRWKADFTGYEIQRVREYGTVIYVLADGEISLAPNGEKWSDLTLQKKFLEGQIADFDIDKNGKMWIVSGVLTRYDLLAETYDVFSGPEYYTSQYGSCIAVDDEDAAWVGTEDKGLYQVDKASSITLNTFVEQPISCSGNGKDAVLRARITGGVPPYTYQWSGGLAGESPANVAPGTYTVTVTDSKGKSRVADVPVPDSRLRIKTRLKKPVSAPGKSDAVAEVDIESNASGLVIHWDNGGAMAVATNLAAGTYNVTVTDPKGCSATASITIADKLLPLEASVTEKNGIKCAGEKAAALNVQVAGGKSPYQYAWNNPALSGEQPANVPAGDYQVTVTDAAGKFVTASVSVKQPEALTVNATALSPASTGNADGKASVQAAGGTGAYAYQWDNGERTANASKLGPGQRSVTVTDANGCAAVATVNISENILTLSVALVEKSPVKCAGEKTAALTVQITGGKGPFRYVWSSASLSGEQAGNVAAGDYSVTVTDVVGMSSAASVSVKQPEALTATASAMAPASTGKTDGKASVQASGGTRAYTYRWDNGENTDNASKLPPGRRSVTVTDANGCSAMASVDISENILPLVVSIAEKNKIKCAGEQAALSVKVTGGKPPHTFAWNTPVVPDDQLVSINAEARQKTPALSGEQPSNLPPGEYVVTVTDAAGTSQTAQISVTSPEPLVAELTRNMGATTERSNDGKAQISVKGGAGNYTIVWDTKQTGASVAKLPLGNHSVTVTDANGCTQKIDFETGKRILPELTGALEKGQVIRMRLLNFDTDSSSLKSESLPMLDELYDFMMENGAAAIEIGGHTNNLPSDAFADELSAARAKSVADYLFAKGIDPKRVVYKGYGKRLPLAPNTSAEGRRTNQRVEIKLLRVTE